MGIFEFSNKKPKRTYTNPAPQTASALEAAKSFYCELCGKGYSRMPEYQAHQSSYDHQHKQRLKDMKEMSKDPNAAAKAKKAQEAEKKKAGIISIKITGEDKPMKKSGFKKLFVSSNDPKEENKLVKDPLKKDDDAAVGEDWEGDEGIWNEGDPGYDYYDPAKPTGCGSGCACHRVEKAEGIV
ncbi:hypothetical protein FKW77_002052 [Venturia effusa]|uniref:C2H2-type domain-containing protein n=1 Tax=Venturia effusa TaxID=50376 RepID=A0A517LI79_9PEZI|nr:hypothetical protein FKW77_002052 [Venturia effusa]